MIDDKDYFDEYSRKINNNPEAIRCIYEYLKNYDIEKVVPKKLFQKHRPSSDMYKELVDSNREKEWYLIRDIVVENIHFPHPEQAYCTQAIAYGMCRKCKRSRVSPCASDRAHAATCVRAGAPPAARRPREAGPCATKATEPEKPWNRLQFARYLGATPQLSMCGPKKP